MARRLIALLSLGGIFLSAYLALYKLGMIGALSCSIGSCETVQLSRWATLFGLPVAVWGIGFYAAVFGLVMLLLGEASARTAVFGWMLAAVTTWGVIFSGWLTYLELFVIDAICMWCVVSAFVTLTIFVLVLVDRPWRVAPGPE